MHPDFTEEEKSYDYLQAENSMLRAELRRKDEQIDYLDYRAREWEQRFIQLAMSLGKDFQPKEENKEAN